MARVLDVGQCRFDHSAIARHLTSRYAAEVVGADSAAEALVSLRAGAFDLVLVNRVLDSDGTSGLDLIRTLRADSQLAATRVLLVSNYPEAQTEARQLGALPGFGKGDLRPGQPIAALDAALAPVAAGLNQAEAARFDGLVP